MNLLQRSRILALRTATFNTHNVRTMASSLDNLDEIHYFARKKRVGVDMRTLLDTGLGRMQFNSDIEGTKLQKVLMQVACFLHRELPVRFAHRTVELETNQYMKDNEHVMKICNWYKSSFRELRECPIPMDVEKGKCMC